MGLRWAGWFLEGEPMATKQIDYRKSSWDRLLWGIVFQSHKGDEPRLIGWLWASNLGGTPYEGEPTRALLFTSRKAARDWCADTMRKWRENRQQDDSVWAWRVRPVRVRESVTPL